MISPKWGDDGGEHTHDRQCPCPRAWVLEEEGVDKGNARGGEEEGRG
jgi:hypothetical protein